MEARHILFLLLGSAAIPGHAQVVYHLDTFNIRPAGEDFAPVIVDSGLVFTSVRERAQAIAYTNASTGKPLTDLYRVHLRGGKPGAAHLMDGTLCSRFNDGPASFSPGGDTICFTRNGAIGKRRQAGTLGLYFAVKKGGAWSEPQPFAYNGDAFSTLDPSFSSNGQRLYFCSDRPGGRGGMDLYVSRRDGTAWSEPRNLGPHVNTAANEAWPSALADGRLVFASDKPGGQGKLDLYFSTSEYGEWNAAKALPAPVNSPGNDLGYTAYPDARIGFFSSDRSGTDRIYRFTRGPAPFRNCAEQQRNSYCFHFEDAGAADADTLPLRYQWDLGDGTKVAALSTDHCFAKPGHYTVKLNLIDTLSESVYFNQVSYELDVADIQQAYINGPDSIGTGLALMLDTAHTLLPGFAAQEVHWDFGDGTTASGDSILHTYTKAGAYTVRMDLLGGPDGKGDFTNHCVFRQVHVIDGLPPEVDTAMEAPPATALSGETKRAPIAAPDTAGKNISYAVQLLASNNRISLNDARFLPIRPYYPVVERFAPKSSLYTYSIGAGHMPFAVYDAFQLAKRSNFTNCAVKAVEGGKDLDLGHLDQLPLEALNNGILRISSVQFKTGESNFDASFDTTLDKITALLAKYGALRLVIQAHTDNVGTANSNLALSQARAQSVMDYFTGHGIAAGHLSPVGFGEDRPMADNATAAGRARNRRVEFHFSVDNANELARP